MRQQEVDRLQMELQYAKKAGGRGGWFGCLVCLVCLFVCFITQTRLLSGVFLSLCVCLFV